MMDDQSTNDRAVAETGRDGNQGSATARPDGQDPGAAGPSGAPLSDPDAGSPGAASSAPGKKKNRSFWRELPVLIVIALVIALVIKSFVVQAFWIPSGSMENTLKVNDRVLINKVVYHLRPIHRGDIVVFDGTGSWNFGPPANANIFSKAV